MLGGPCPLPCHGMERFCFQIRSTRPRILLLNSFHSTLSVERDCLTVRQQQFRTRGNNSSAAPQAFSCRSWSCDHLARHLPRICPRGCGRSVGAPRYPPPLQNQELFGFRSLFFGEIPFYERKKEKKYEKRLNCGPTQIATGNPVTFKLEPHGLQRSPKRPVWSRIGHLFCKGWRIRTWHVPHATDRSETGFIVVPPLRRIE